MYFHSQAYWLATTTACPVWAWPRTAWRLPQAPGTLSCASGTKPTPSTPYKTHTTLPYPRTLSLLHNRSMCVTPVSFLVLYLHMCYNGSHFCGNTCVVSSIERSVTLSAANDKTNLHEYLRIIVLRNVTNKILYIINLIDLRTRWMSRLLMRCERI